MLYEVECSRFREKLVVLRFPNEVVRVDLENELRRMGALFSGTQRSILDVIPIDQRQHTEES